MNVLDCGDLHLCTGSKRQRAQLAQVVLTIPKGGPHSRAEGPCMMPQADWCRTAVLHPGGFDKLL